MDGDVRIDYNVLFTIHRALERAHKFLLRRDEMNSEIHCQKVRLSPLTECVGSAELKALEALSEYRNNHRIPAPASYFADRG